MHSDDYANYEGPNEAQCPHASLVTAHILYLEQSIFPIRELPSETENPWL